MVENFKKNWYFTADYMFFNIKGINYIILCYDKTKLCIISYIIYLMWNYAIT
jgi:hypothetical protein